MNADIYLTTDTTEHGSNMFAYCENNPVNCVDAFGEWPSTLKDVFNRAKQLIENVFIIRYDVPLYNQGSTKLCWAYSQMMIEDYHNGEVRDQKQADIRAYHIAVEKNGEEWDRGNSPEYEEKLYIRSPLDLYKALNQYGPLYAVYTQFENGHQLPKGHAVVITGINLLTREVYTNNPWGVYGFQQYEDFVKGYVNTNPNECWRFRFAYYLTD